MIELMLITSALICLGVCSYFDYMTGKFYIVFIHIGIPIAIVLKIVLSVLNSNPWIIINSVVIGSFFAVSGYTLLKKDKWAEGDAWVLPYLFILSPEITTIVLFGIISTVYVLISKRINFNSVKIHFVPVFFLTYVASLFV